MVQKGKNDCFKRLTIEDIATDFLTKAKTRLKESTFSRYSFICKRHIIPYFQCLELHSINNSTINSFIQGKLSNGSLSGNPMSPKTVNDMVSLLMQIIKSHCQFELDIEKPSCRLKEVSVFTETEYNKLKTYLSIGTDTSKLGIITAMLTGVRIGELCALKWENIDLENGTLLIDKTIQRVENTDNSQDSKTKIIIDTPKSNASVRTIPIPTILLIKLRKFKSPENSYVLTNTEKFIEPRIYQRHFKGYLQDCNIRDNNFHTLRHTFATMAISRGMDIKTLSVLLGHTDVGFTMKRYVHPNIEHKRAQIEKMAVGF